MSKIYIALSVGVAVQAIGLLQANGLLNEDGADVTNFGATEQPGFTPPAPAPAPAPYTPPAPAPAPYVPPAPAPIAPAPAPVPAAPVPQAPAPQAPAAVQTGAYTVAQVAAALQAYAKRNNAKAAKALLNKYGADAVGKVDPGYFPQLMAEAQA